MTNEPIECRAAVEISPTTRNELLFLPTGLHAITPVAGGIGRPIKVKIDERAADAIEQQRRIMAGKGKRPYFDFNHEDGPASFWPESFAWRNGEGVVAKGEWSARGRKAVEGKDYRAFSPVFHVDNKRSDPAQVICKEHAEPNMGGLVNNPAFNNLPLWAKNAGVTAQSTNNPEAARLYGTNNKETQMSNEDIAALRAEHQELENKVQNLSAIVAQNNDDETANARLNAAQAQSDLKASQIEAAELRATNEAFVAKQRKRQQEDAQTAVRAAVKRGAIAARDLPKQRMWETRIAANPKDQEILDSIPGNAALNTSVINAARVTITDDDPSRVYGEMARVLAISASTSKYEDRRNLSREFASIYTREIRGSNQERMLSFPVSDFETAIMAADVTDANLATLSGSLVTQRTLELLAITFPPLTMFTTDFSDQPASYGQTIITRTIGIPSVTDYNTSTGWAASTATTTDVPITINKHKGVNIVFHEQLLASTVRRLFDEFAPASAYAMAKQMVDDLYVNITDANFTNNTVKATSSFAGSDVIDIGTQLDIRGVPLLSRTMLLYPTVFGKLKQDTRLTNPAIYVYPQLLTDSRTGPKLVIDVDSFQVCTAPNLPTNNGNVTGFAGSRSALIIATRMPNDYTTAMPGASYGNVQMITAPDIGISVMLTQFVDHKLANATFRISLMYGTAAGQTAAGQLLKAASGSGSSRT